MAKCLRCGAGSEWIEGGKAPRKDAAAEERQRIISELLRKADEAHDERDYARESRMREAAWTVNDC